MKSRTIGYKVTGFVLAMVFLAMFFAGTVSMFGLYAIKQAAMEYGRELGKTAADDAEEALEEMAAEHLQDIAAEKAAYIDEKFAAVEAYVKGIAAQAEDIYSHPENYPDREVALPVQGSRELAAQLLWSRSLEAGKAADTERLKLGNIQDLLVQYNSWNDMVSSVYIATESGWMIQADCVAYSKYDSSGKTMRFEAQERQWYQRGKSSERGEVVYTDVLWDFYKGGECIVCASPVYCGEKVVAVAGVGSYLETVKRAVIDTAIGEKGYAFLVNQNGQVLVSGKTEGETAAYAEQAVDLRRSNDTDIAEIASEMADGRTGSRKMILDGEEVYLSYAPMHRLGWSFVTVMNVEEVIAPAKESQGMILALMQDMGERQNKAAERTIVFFAVALAAAALCICSFGTLFSRKLTEPIRRLTREVAKIDGGNLDYRICISTGDEVENLAAAFNGMTAQMQEYIENLAKVTAEKERIRTEIQLASRLQADMLPEAKGAFADRKDFALSALMRPAKGVGGDFYDFYLLDNNHLALVIADVSGKGVPAALFMVVARTFIRSLLTRDTPLEQAAERINDCLCRNNKNGMFVTAWLGILTLSTGELTFVNAGHCRPLVIRSGGGCRYENSFGGFVLAGIEGESYRSSRIDLWPGDKLLLYTDGVTEATSAAKELYGENRLLETAGKEKGQLPEKLLAEVWEDVDNFQKDTEQFDDVTMLAVAYYGSGYAEKTGKPDQGFTEETIVFLEKYMDAEGIPDEVIRIAAAAADEILSNICYYSGAKTVTVRIRAEEKGMVVLSFEDDGFTYNPLERAEPDVEKRLEEGVLGGLGIYLVKKRMDEVRYEYRDGKNCLVLKKGRKKTDELQ